MIQKPVMKSMNKYTLSENQVELIFKFPMTKKYTRLMSGVFLAYYLDFEL
jgi:hypothetical protein